LKWSLEKICIDLIERFEQSDSGPSAPDLLNAHARQPWQ
jgi:hypothetical protein